VLIILIGTYLTGLFYFLFGMVEVISRVSGCFSGSIKITDDCCSCTTRAASYSFLVVIPDKSISKKEVFVVVSTVLDILQFSALLY
jgi:hypothetical protein